MPCQLDAAICEGDEPEARLAGHSTMCLDVLPEFLAAQQLCRTLGFEPAAAVCYNPVPGTRFLALRL